MKKSTKPQPEAAGTKIQMTCDTIVDGRPVSAGDVVSTNAHDAAHLIRIRKAVPADESESQS